MIIDVNTPDATVGDPPFTNYNIFEKSFVNVKSYRNELRIGKNQIYRKAYFIGINNLNSIYNGIGNADGIFIKFGFKWPHLGFMISYARQINALGATQLSDAGSVHYSVFSNGFYYKGIRLKNRLQITNQFNETYFKEIGTENIGIPAAVPDEIRNFANCGIIPSGFSEAGFFIGKFFLRNTSNNGILNKIEDDSNGMGLFFSFGLVDNKLFLTISIGKKDNGYIIEDIQNTGENTGNPLIFLNNNIGGGGGTNPPNGVPQVPQP